MVRNTFGGIELEIIYLSLCYTLVTLLNIFIDPIIFETIMDGVLRYVGRPILGPQVELVMLATTF